MLSAKTTRSELGTVAVTPGDTSTGSDCTVVFTLEGNRKKSVPCFPGNVTAYPTRFTPAALYPGCPSSPPCSKYHRLFGRGLRKLTLSSYSGAVLGQKKVFFLIPLFNIPEATVDARSKTLKAFKLPPVGSLSL